MKLLAGNSNRTPGTHHVALVVAVERHDGVDRVGVEQKQDGLLRLVPRAVAAVEKQKRLAVRRHILPIQDRFEVRHAFRAGARELRRDGSACQQKDEPIPRLLGRKVRTEQPDVVDRADYTAGWRGARIPDTGAETACRRIGSRFFVSSGCS